MIICSYDNGNYTVIDATVDATLTITGFYGSCPNCTSGYCGGCAGYSYHPIAAMAAIEEPATIDDFYYLVFDFLKVLILTIIVLIPLIRINPRKLPDHFL